MTWLTTSIVHWIHIRCMMGIIKQTVHRMDKCHDAGVDVAMQRLLLDRLSACLHGLLAQPQGTIRAKIFEVFPVLPEVKKNCLWNPAFPVNISLLVARLLSRGIKWGQMNKRSIKISELGAVITCTDGKAFVTTEYLITICWFMLMWMLPFDLLRTECHECHL